MEKGLKKAIGMAFEAPAPERKTEFLARISYGVARKSSRYEIVCSQIGYIHKGAWFCAAVVFCTVLFFLSHRDPDTVFLAGALSPFLALAVLIEGSRSHRYNMEELEAAAKYSLRSVFFSKMLILGVFDLVLLLLIIMVTRLHTGYGLLLTSAYILLPYLLTMWLGLVVEMSAAGREIPYAAVGVSITVSIALLILMNRNITIFDPDHGIWWEIMTVLLLAGTVLRGKKKMIRMEEPLWN